MSSSESSIASRKLDVVLEVQSIDSTEDPPMSEWSSVVVFGAEKTQKELDYEAGLYDPGSGEVCIKYAAQSDSAIFRHPYFKYPPVTDPGIEEALLEPEPEVVFDDDGQDRYMALCNEMNHAPVRLFYGGLLESVIDLSYYGVHSPNVRAMANALYYNRSVLVLNLTDNFLSIDACYHLGEMLKVNSTLRELDLSGCRVGAEGAKRIFLALEKNKTLKILNMARNELNNDGGVYFAESTYRKIHIEQINLSYNNLGNTFAVALIEALELYNKLTHIDLSWNNLYIPSGTCALLNSLAENKSLQYLNLAWNCLQGLRIAESIKKVMRAPDLRYLDLNNNKFSSEEIPTLIANLGRAKKLVTFNLSGNPLSPSDAITVLSKLKFRVVKVQNLLMDHITVNKTFLELLTQVKSLKFRETTVITHGEPMGMVKAQPPDPRHLILDRADFLCKQPKKDKVDIALIFLQLIKNGSQVMDFKSLSAAVKELGAPLDDDLMSAIADAFPGPKSVKYKLCDLMKVREFMQRKWPDRQLLPTPPPETVGVAEEVKPKGKTEKGKTEKGKTEKGKTEKSKKKGKK